MGAAASSLFWTKRSDHGDFIIAAANGDAEKCLAIINRAPGITRDGVDSRRTAAAHDALYILQNIHSRLFELDVVHNPIKNFGVWTGEAGAT